MWYGAVVMNKNDEWQFHGWRKCAKISQNESKWAKMSQAYVESAQEDEDGAIMS